MKLFEIFGEIDVKNDKANLSIDQTDSKSKTLASTFGNLSTKSVAVTAAIAAIGVAAVKGIADITKASIKAFDDQERAEKRLESIAKKVTKATDEQISSLKELASQYQTVTTYGDDLIIAGQSQLLSFGVNTEQAGRLTQSMVDLVAATKGASATQEDFVSAANLLGKAVNGEAGVLREAGILLTERQKLMLQNGRETQRVAVLTQILNDNYGELAQGMAQTREGQMLQFKNALGDIGERFAGVLMPALEGFTKFLKGPVLDAIGSLVDWFEKWGPAMAKAFIPVFESIYAALKPVFSLIKAAFPILKPIFEFVINAVTGIGLIFGFVAKTVVLAINPVIKVIEGLLATIKNIFDFVNNTFTKVGELFDKAFGPAIEVVETVIGWIDNLLEKLISVFDYLKNLGGGASQAIKDALAGGNTPIPETIKREFPKQQDLQDVIRGLQGSTVQPTVTQEFAQGSINVTIPAKDLKEMQTVADFFNRIPQLRRTVNA